MRLTIEGVGRNLEGGYLEKSQRVSPVERRAGGAFAATDVGIDFPTQAVVVSFMKLLRHLGSIFAAPTAIGSVASRLDDGGVNCQGLRDRLRKSIRHRNQCHYNARVAWFGQRSVPAVPKLGSCRCLAPKPSLHPAESSSRTIPRRAIPSPISCVACAAAHEVGGGSTSLQAGRINGYGLLLLPMGCIAEAIEHLAQYLQNRACLLELW